MMAKIIFIQFFYIVSSQDNSHPMNSIFKPNEMKIRRIQTPTQYLNNGNSYKMKPDSHGKYTAFKNHSNSSQINLSFIVFIISLY